METLELTEKDIFSVLNLLDYVEQNSLLLKWFAAHSSIWGQNVNILNWTNPSCLNDVSDVIFIIYDMNATSLSFVYNLQVLGKSYTHESLDSPIRVFLYI